MQRSGDFCVAPQEQKLDHWRFWGDHGRSPTQNYRESNIPCLTSPFFSLLL
jgi:hypothetical protein